MIVFKTERKRGNVNSEQFRDVADKSETLEQDELLIECEENEEMKFMLNRQKFEIDLVQ
jgi:hypothetical protein